MANITETKVVQISLIDTQNRTRTFNIDNPVSDITFLKVQTAVAPAIQGGWWCSSYGDPFTELSKVVLSTGSKIPLDRGEATVAPNSLTFPVTYAANAIQSNSVTVSNGNIVNASFALDNNTNVPDMLFYAKFVDNSVDVVVRNLANSEKTVSNSLTGTVLISLDDIVVRVPVTFSD